MSWGEIVGAAILTLAVAGCVHALLHLHRYWKDPAMPKYRETDDAWKGEPDPLTARPGDEAHSVNDVHTLREQDQSIAQLAAQLEGMVEEPWSRGTLNADQWGGPQPKTQLRALAIQLTLGMTPPAAKGSQQAVSGYGTLQYLNVGNQRITAAGPKEADKLLKTLNDLYYVTIAPWRAVILKRMASLAGAEVDDPFQGPIYTVECGQTRLGFETEEERDHLCVLLNNAFRPFFDTERKRIRDEILTVIGA